MAPHAVARSFPHAEIELGADPVSVPLRIGPAQQRHFVEHVAVHHGDGSGLANLLNGVHEKGGRDAFEREIHLVDAGPAHRELAAEVVAGRDAGQHLDGAHRIVGDHAAQLLQIAAPECLLRGDGGLQTRHQRAADGHRLGIGTRAFREHDRQVHCRSGLHVDRALGQHEIDSRDVQLVGTGRHVGNLEASLIVGHRGLPRFLQPHGDFADARSVACVDDGPANRSGLL